MLEEVDALWLKRKLQDQIAGITPEDAAEYETQILGALGDHQLSVRDCEKKLFSILTYKRVDLVRELVKQRYTIFYGIRLRRAKGEEEKHAIEEEMKASPEGR